MSTYWSIKEGGFKAPTSGPDLELFDYIITHQPAEFLDDPNTMKFFEKIYGKDLTRLSIQTRKVPENMEEKWLMFGPHFKIGEDLKPADWPAPGEPAYVKRLEAKIDAILAWISR